MISVSNINGKEFVKTEINEYENKANQMGRVLINSEKELLDFFIEALQVDCKNKNKVEELEEFLGCYFAFSDGQFFINQDFTINNNINETLPIDLNNYMKWEKNNFPNDYPCLVIYDFQVSSDDICDDNFVKVCEFVYLNEFEQ